MATVAAAKDCSAAFRHGEGARSRYDWLSPSIPSCRMTKAAQGLRHPCLTRRRGSCPAYRAVRNAATPTHCGRDAPGRQGARALLLIEQQPYTPRMTDRARSPAERYRRLDELLTELFETAKVDITPEVDNLLCHFNWELREALRLPNSVH